MTGKTRQRLTVLGTVSFCHPFGHALFPLSFEVMIVCGGFFSDRIQDTVLLKYILKYSLHAIIFFSPIQIRSQHLFISFP